MKKILFFAALAAVTLASCSSDDVASTGADSSVSANDGAINFSAYTGSSVAARGTVKTASDFNEKGIGVFAFYQPKASGDFNTYTYIAPDFMDNKQVTPNVEHEYTATQANAYNAKLTDAVKTGDTQTPAVKYTAETAAAYNATLTGAVKAGDINDSGEKYTAETAAAYNATLTGAKKDGDEQTAAVLYTDETAAAHNATLTGAVKAGKVYGNVWSYSPIMYWPNNVGDKLSFFAYAPYNADKTWEDMSIKTDVKGKSITINCPIYPEVRNQEDYLYATPQINLSKQTTAEKVSFNFKHITSQVNLFAGVEQNTAAQEPTKWDDSNTEIDIKSIVFKKLSTGMTYKLDLTKNAGESGYETYSQSTETQDIELTTENFNAAAATINSTNYATAEFKALNTTDDVMFLAPQTLSEAVVTYTVTTEGSLSITNKMTADLSGLTLEAGKSYKLNFLIGMNSVKVVATVADWVDGDTKQYDIPANE